MNTQEKKEALVQAVEEIAKKKQLTGKGTRRCRKPSRTAM